MPSPEVNRRISKRLRELHERHMELEEGAVSQYYPPDSTAEERDRFGICLATVDGHVWEAGDHDVAFPLQSISKVFAYALALDEHGRDAVRKRVGVEPSGDAFNSIVFDERAHRPFNPMVNAGAIVTTDLVAGEGREEKLGRILELVRTCAGNDAIDVDRETFEREQGAADRNRATAYLMRSLEMIEADVEMTLALYLEQCSIAVTCRDLAVIAATLANGWVNPTTGRAALSRSTIRDVLSVMYTCGMYDAAGQWATEVGVPAKSGVSGGIMAVIPGKLGVAVYSPGLDDFGNSVRGVRVCEEISERLGLHVFATEDEDEMHAPGPAGS